MTSILGETGILGRKIICYTGELLSLSLIHLHKYYWPLKRGLYLLLLNCDKNLHLPFQLHCILCTLEQVCTVCTVMLFLNLWSFGSTSIQSQLYMYKDYECNFKFTIENSITCICCVLRWMFLFPLQRTPMEEATKRGHMDIVQHLRQDGILDVNVGNYSCTLEVE